MTQFTRDISKSSNVMKLAFGMPWCALWRFAPQNSVMYFTVPLVASWCIQIIFNPPITTSGELVSLDRPGHQHYNWHGLRYVFKTHRYLACYRCQWLRLLGNHWCITRYRTFHLPVSSFHRHIFALILTLYIVISTLQCLPMEITFDPCLKLHTSFWISTTRSFPSHVMGANGYGYRGTVGTSLAVDPFMCL